MRASRFPLVAVLAVGFVAACSTAEPRPEGPPDIDVKRVAEHLERFDDIAEYNDGNRAAGTSGYAESAEYLATELEEAGFDVERQACEDCTDPEDVNVIAEWGSKAKGDTVMFGAHLDSVAEGPGINDNGSGSAVLLEVALRLADTDPDMSAPVRFAWWAEEEAGMIGSAYYVDNTYTTDLAVYYNLDMVASTNTGYFVTHMDTKYGKAYADYLDSVGVKAEAAEANCDCSDDQPFADDDVSTVYVNTGDEVEMTSAQAKRWDGEAGEVFDPCYHAACDEYPDNIDTDALNHNADATAHVLWAFAATAKP
ncbi:M20/M25/M40 family metallo-hydrolase [Stackebrandtia nassauensis]|uniref:Peptidase M28 n=1 Tax=Stackebrandtia nassauensis (strain DSM 44728 / CIP 108903 / NRRL B-16338 / NBRC 102104 / LLR-40K-21) TaxID=446470 RepID=D3Q0M8_STANL|nr:M20/M25/M40 family metallo-hydrolase [Stackebrandtia nassauensis]ADD41764.1 peptidase M28 [Stackebrandtia nassauensis DSM 44728]